MGEVLPKISYNIIFIFNMQDNFGQLGHPIDKLYY